MQRCSGQRCRLANFKNHDIAESYPEQKVLTEVVQVARHTLTYFERNGVFNEARTLEEFQRSGLHR